MSSRFTVLASGSAGNAALLDANGFRLLIDCGLSARQIGQRLTKIGLHWSDIHAVVLTHTHSDHWSESTIKALAANGVPFYCHRDHVHDLVLCESFELFRQSGRVHQYVAGDWLNLASQLRILPHEVSHDAEPTFAFRCEGVGGMFGADWSVGYAADLGTWDEKLAELLADSDILAIEFNHDEHMQRSSGRSRDLIARVLGPRGHLSNRQGAALVEAAIDRSSKPPRSLVTLHRSQQCNTPDLVMTEASKVVGTNPILIQLAEQQQSTEAIELTSKTVSRSSNKKRPRRQSATAGLFTD